MDKNSTELVEITRDYYNSDDADNFYYTIWGGEDLHLGIYNSEEDSIFEASRRTIDRMASKSTLMGKDVKVLDMGSGYGGTARHLARSFGCTVTALNLSEKENERNRKMNEEQGLADRIEVIDGNFEELPGIEETYDIIWSQDAFLHSSRKEKIIEEAFRVLKKGGEFIFTDPMQSDKCPPNVLGPILERIHLESMASPGFYKEVCQKSGFTIKEFEDQTENLTLHYRRVLEETEKNEDNLKKTVSHEYIENMKRGLNLWVDGGKKGYLAWGIFVFTK